MASAASEVVQEEVEEAVAAPVHRVLSTLVAAADVVV